MDYSLICLCTFQVNCVVMRGVNEEEILDFVELTKLKVSIYSFAFQTYLKNCNMFQVYHAHSDCNSCYLSKLLFSTWVSFLPI